MLFKFHPFKRFDVVCFFFLLVGIMSDHVLPSSETSSAPSYKIKCDVVRLLLVALHGEEIGLLEKRLQK